MHESCPLFTQAKKRKDHPALITKEKTYSYQELNALTHSLSEELKKFPEKWVLFPGKTSLATICFFFALFRRQKIACPLSTRIPSEMLPSYCGSFPNSLYLKPEEISLHPTVCSQAPIYPSEIATALFTSGTTAFPKIACHTLKAHLKHAQIASSHLHVTEQSRYLLTVPLFHVSGLSILFRVFSQGGTLVLSDLPLEEALITHAITHLSLVPTQLYRLVQTKTHFPDLQVLLVGGSPLSESLKAQAAGLPLYITYGMTETSSMATLAPPGVPGVGKPIIPLRLGFDGEIFVSGETLFSGYFNPKTHKVDPAGYELATKDRADLLADGSLTILGRKDRLFISGGENIQPEEIERALLSLPGIERAYVTQAPDPEFGARPIAYLLSHTPYTLEEIRTLLKPILPSFKHPIRLHPFTPEQLQRKN